jgi:hypothetical protein
MPRHPVVVASSLLVGAAALAGCAQKAPDIPTVRSTTAEPVAQYPITIYRSGGVAGFQDELRISSDGSVAATSKKPILECRLDAESLRLLNRAAAHIRPSDLPTDAPTTTSDAMTVTVVAGAGVVSVDDERMAEAKPVIDQLLADVNSPAGQRKICT